MGISFYEKDYIDAEMALSIAKENRKDIMFDENSLQVKSDYGKHIIWLKKLKSAIEDNRIVPFYQPIVDKNCKIVKYEALVRMIDEDGKVISPFFFLDVAKKSRLYLEITKIVIQKAFKVIKEKNISISVNLTLEDIESEDMREFIISEVRNCVNKEKITFEIVENEDVRESELVSQFMKELQNEGCQIYIDDFGSGYSNFDYLLKLNPNGVKIDGSLIKNILENKNNQIIVKTIINFAKETGIKTVAEFVENKEIFDKLREMGIDYYQGYYFSPPQKEIKETNEIGTC
jgi:EAL domain-containing protein (putative c-di-GMP-specific phosphodiesterase class I)